MPRRPAYRASVYLVVNARPHPAYDLWSRLIEYVLACAVVLRARQECNPFRRSALFRLSFPPRRGQGYGLPSSGSWIPARCGRFRSPAFFHPSTTEMAVHWSHQRPRPPNRKSGMSRCSAPRRRDAAFVKIPSTRLSDGPTRGIPGEDSHLRRPRFDATIPLEPAIAAAGCIRPLRAPRRARPGKPEAEWEHR
jgi:hypothetical protein